MVMRSEGRRRPAPGFQIAPPPAWVSLLVLGWLLGACAPTPTPAPVVLHVEATDLAAPLLADLAQAYAAANPSVTLQTETVPLSALTTDLAAGRADLGLAATYTPDQFATPLGYVAWAVIVNPTNVVNSLSPAQVRDLMGGRTPEWGGLGGPAGVVQVVCREDASDAAQAFDGLALAGAWPTSNALVAPTWAAVRQAVGQNAAALGYLPEPELAAGVKPVALTTDWRTLLVAVAPKAPAGAARDFVAWAQSAAGQKVVASRYQPLK